MGVSHLIRARKQQPQQNLLLRLIHPIILVGIILGIVGGTNRIPDSSTGTVDPHKYDQGATFSKVSSILFIVAIIAITIAVTRLCRIQESHTAVSYLVLNGMTVVLPLLLVRVIYSVLNAFNPDTTSDRGHTTKFNVMTGSWVIYLFLGLITQAVIVVVYAGCGVLEWVREPRGGFEEEENRTRF